MHGRLKRRRQSLEPVEAQGLVDAERLAERMDLSLDEPAQNLGWFSPERTKWGGKLSIGACCMASRTELFGVDIEREIGPRGAPAEPQKRVAVEPFLVQALAQAGADERGRRLDFHSMDREKTADHVLHRKQSRHLLGNRAKAANE